MEVVVNKIESIKRCIKRIDDEYKGNDSRLENYTIQDSIVLNLQRACELSIDIANYVISKFKFAIPKITREAFDILNENKVIDDSLNTKMKKMVGFRNIAVHNYAQLDIKILSSVIKNNLMDFEEFYDSILKYLKEV